FAVAALIVIAAGFAAAHYKFPRTGWMHVHLTCMVASFYILIGGAVNEVFLRATFLRRLIPDFNRPVAVGVTQVAVLLLFAFLIVWFNVAARMRARDRRRVPLHGEAVQQGRS